MIELRAWSTSDLPILQKTVGDEIIMRHLGGAETRKQIIARHGRYVNSSEDGGMFTISLAADSLTVGTVGFWETTWQGERIYETGWMVLGDYQGRGIATEAASAIVTRAMARRKHRFLHAFPSVSNTASNKVCEKSGFTNLGQCTHEYPKGHFMQINDWRVDLFSIAFHRATTYSQTVFGTNVN